MKCSALLLGLPLIGGCSASPPCSTETIESQTNSAHSATALTQIRNCAATTDFFTVVRLVEQGHSADGQTEIFVADSAPGAAFGGPKNSIWMNVVWTSPDHLLVNYAEGARVFKAVYHAGGTTVSYRQSGPPFVAPVP